MAQVCTTMQGLSGINNTGLLPVVDQLKIFRNAFQKLEFRHVYCDFNEGVDTFSKQGLNLHARAFKLEEFQEALLCPCRLLFIKLL